MEESARINAEIESKRREIERRVEKKEAEAEAEGEQESSSQSSEPSEPSEPSQEAVAEKKAAAAPRPNNANFLGFTAYERDVMTGTGVPAAAAATTSAAPMDEATSKLSASEWMEQWQCLPDEAHRYDESTFNDHCAIPEKRQPAWMRRDPYVEAMLSDQPQDGVGAMQANCEKLVFDPRL